MATPTSAHDSRDFDRVLAFTRDAVIMRPDVTDHAFNHSTAVAIFFNQLLGRFGSVRGSGMGKRAQMGGESISVRMNMAKGNAGTMAGPWGQHGTAPSDTMRNSRANWKHYWANITLSDTDLLVNRGAEALASLVEFETKKAMRTLADLVGDHIYGPQASAQDIVPLDAAISANDAVQGLSGATHPAFNARGVSARGTAPASISFAASGAFATNGLSDMVRAYNNCMEGAFMANVLLSDHASFEKYENALQAQQRFQNRDVADGSFQNLAFKSIPYMPDDKAPANTQWFLNIGEGVEFVCLEGADFTAQEFKRAHDQEAKVSEIQLKGELTVLNRRYNNKITGIS